MKKLGLICLLAIVLASPSFASAQTVTQEEVNAQIQVILNQLLAQVQELMTKLIAMQTKQAEDSTKIGVIESTVKILNPNVGGVSTSNSSAPSVSFGTPTCVDKTWGSISIPFTTTGSQWKVGTVSIGGSGGTSFENKSYAKYFWFDDKSGTTTLTTVFGDSKNSYGSVIPTHTFTDTIFIGDICQ